MTDTPEVPFERRMLIDGELVDGEAGTFTNVNPATEEALGEVADASAADMQRAIDDEGVRTEVISRDDPVPVSPLGGLAWELVAATVEKTFPGTVVAPYIQTGATDSRHFTRICTGVYRFTPFEMSREERDTLHARNERMRVASWLDGIRFYRALLAAL